MRYVQNDSLRAKAGRIQDLDFLQDEPDTSIEPPDRYLFGLEM